MTRSAGRGKNGVWMCTVCASIEIVGKLSASNRDERTQAAFEEFVKRTGVIPAGARKHQGSMRGYVSIELWVTDEVAEFCENYYKESGTKVFHGVTTSYMGSYWSGESRRVSFEIKWSELV